MKNRIRNKLFLLLKLCIFNILATASLLAHAEYYMVYASPEPSELCTFCQGSPHHISAKHHKVAHKKTYSAHAHHRYHNRSGLYVYYPGNQRPTCPCNEVWTLDYCQCCAHPNHVRSQWGDYVVFSTRPADTRHGIYEEAETSYNPDMSTTDDGRGDLEIN